MGSLSIWHILILLVVALLLFGGRGKISDLMGDVAKGIKSFRQGLNDPDHTITSDKREDAQVNKDQTVGR
jgi:sec-independent protein translocase protein TatA